MQIRKHQLQEIIHSIEYDHYNDLMTFNKLVNGFEVPFSIIKIDVPEYATYFPIRLKRLHDLYKITPDKIMEGMHLCKALHGSY